MKWSSVFQIIGFTSAIIVVIIYMFHLRGGNNFSKLLSKVSFKNSVSVIANLDRDKHSVKNSTRTNKSDVIASVSRKQTATLLSTTTQRNIEDQNNHKREKSSIISSGGTKSKTVVAANCTPNWNLFAKKKPIKNNRTLDLEVFCPNKTILKGLCQKGWRLEDLPRCLMTFNFDGRLGNTMGQYATLYALSRWNGRPAFMLPKMANVLRPYFRVTMPALGDRAAICLKNSWQEFKLNDWMVDSYRSISADPQLPLMLTGYPYSWTFYDHIREEIMQEFRLHDHLEVIAKKTLNEILLNRKSATFVGVHVRRSDYVTLMAGQNHGMVADSQFLTQAMTHFRSRYDDAVFVVVSDDMGWCLENMNNSRGDISFAGNGDISNPIHDLALLMNCDHSIIAIGTYGYWGAYLAGGETVYMTNYTLPNSVFQAFFHFKDAYLPSWTPIAANMTTLLNKFKKTIP